MQEIKKVVGVNLLIFVAYTVLSHFSSSSRDGGGDGNLMISGLAIWIQAPVNFFLCLNNFSKGKKELGRAYLLSLSLILLIGFSTCFGAIKL